MDQEHQSTEEDWELEHYGLTEGQVSGSGESDVEEALYRQVHYNLADSETLRTGCVKEFPDPDLAENYPSLTIVPEMLVPISQIGEPGITLDCSSKSQNDSTGVVRPLSMIPDVKSRENSKSRSEQLMGVEANLEIDDVSVASDDESNGRGVKRGKSVSEGKTEKKAGKEAGTDEAAEVSEKDAIIIPDSRDSDVVVLDKSREESKAEQPLGRVLKKRPWKEGKSEGATKKERVHVDRNSWSVASNNRKNVEKPATAVDDITNSGDRTSDIESVRGSKREPEMSDKTPKKKRKASLDEAGFFIDCEGMALDDMRKERTDAEQGWRDERKRTKDMLKKSMHDDMVAVHSSDEDCMAIESCSEEEGLAVHFEHDSNADLPPEKNKTDHTQSSSEGWRKGGSDPRPGRYFVQSLVQKHIRCYNCSELGHTKRECPKPKYIPVCILCGNRGHTDKKCPDALCVKCSFPGHKAKRCPIKKNLRKYTCSRCHMPGHLPKDCTDLWRQYHLTTKWGKIIKPKKHQRKVQTEGAYCCNCGQKGHKYYDCSQPRFDEYTLITYDEVCRYEKSQRFQFYPNIAHKVEFPRRPRDVDAGGKRKDIPRRSKKRKFSLEDEGDASQATSSNQRQDGQPKRTKSEQPNSIPGFVANPVSFPQSGNKTSKKNKKEKMVQSGSSQQNPEGGESTEGTALDPKAGKSIGKGSEESKKGYKEGWMERRDRMRQMWKEQKLAKKAKRQEELQQRQAEQLKKESTRGFHLNRGLLSHQTHHHGNMANNPDDGGDFPRSSGGAPTRQENADAGTLIVEGTKKSKRKTRKERMRLKEKLVEMKNTLTDGVSAFFEAPPQWVHENKKNRTVHYNTAYSSPLVVPGKKKKNRKNKNKSQ